MPSPSTSKPSRRVRQGMAKTSPASWYAGSWSHATEPVKRTASPTPSPAASRTSSFRYGPPPTSNKAASGTESRTCGQARMRTSCPLRGTSRETHTTTGRAPSRIRSRSGPPPAPGRKTVPSTPGASQAIRAAARTDRARASRARVYSPRYVTVSTTSPIRRRSCCAPGRTAQPASWPWVSATNRSTPRRRRAGASSPSGAAAPKSTEVQRSARATSTARRSTPGSGSISDVGWRTTGNG